MNEPILEALNFALDTDLQVEDFRAPSSSAAGPLYSRRPLPVPKNSKKILPSSVILGENCDTPCLIKGCVVITPNIALKENKDTFLAHLLTDHLLVIDDVDKIANLHKYVIYWKEKFLTAPLTDYCVGFLMDDVPTPPPLPIKKKKVGDSSAEPQQDKPEVDKPKPMYYMLTHALEEDKELRSKLWNSRLETILEVNREEREQQDFSRQCFFCREVFTGNRANLFHHMQTDHSFHFGKPDNIVFVEEFLEIISTKLNALICLNCEKVFKDKTILRDHMRKKGHKRLNSNNPEYNRYYIINYLEPGKDWKQLEDEDQEDERVEEDWTEANEEKSNIVCLFCSEQNPNFEEILEHMKSRHFFDFLKVTENLDFYQKVKIVNFIRRTVFLTTCLFCEMKFLERTSLVQHVSEHNQKNPGEFPPQKVWNQPEYFFPTYENDQFLVLLDKDAPEDDMNSTVSSEDESKGVGLVIPEDLPKFSSSQLSQQDFGTMDVEYDYAVGLKEH